MTNHGLVKNAPLHLASHSAIISRIRSSTQSDVRRASASWSQQSSIVSLRARIACQGKQVNVSQTASNDSPTPDTDTEVQTAFLLSSGMPMGSHTKHGTTFCGKPVCVAHVQCPKEAKTHAPKVLRERNMSLYNVRNYLLEFRRISEVDILVQTTLISTVPGEISIPVSYKLQCTGTPTLIILRSSQSHAVKPGTCIFTPT